MPIEIIYPELSEITDVGIYRYLSAQAFIETLMTRKLRFTQIADFFDQHEGILSKPSRDHRKEVDQWLSLDSGIQFVREDTHFDITELQLRHFNYSTCWTLDNPLTTPHWSEYNGDKYNSVAIMTSIKALAKGFNREPISATIRKISYFDFENTAIKDFDDNEVIYYKDKSFNWENEVRFNLNLEFDRTRPKNYKFSHLPKYEYEAFDPKYILGFYCHPLMPKYLQNELQHLHPFV